MDSKEETDLSKAVLEPDHPLLAQFQKALREYLISQIDRAKEDIFGIEQNITEKTKEIELVGERTYAMQQMVCKQHNQLEELIENIKLKESQQVAEENMLVDNKKVLKEIENKLLKSQKANRELVAETEAVADLNNHLLRFEGKIETHINVNRRIAEKARKDNELLTKQKMEQDFMLCCLEKELWKQENELEQVHLQMSAQQTELDKLEELVVTENTNISARQTEYKCLMLSWRTAYHAVGARTKTFDHLNDKLSKLKEKLQAMKLQTTKTKKLIKLELEENEKLALLKTRVDLDIKNIASQLDEEGAKKSGLENGRLELERIMQETDVDLERVKEEIKPKQSRLDAVLRESNLNRQKKRVIEKEIVDTIQNNITNEALRKKVHSTLSILQRKKQEIELVLLEAENRQAGVTADYEAQKIHNENLNIIYNDLRSQLDKLEKEAVQLKAQREKLEFRYRKLQKTSAEKSIQLEKLIASRSAEIGSKSELKVVELNKAIEETQESFIKLELYWLREQNNILTVSDERQEQIQKVDLRKKEVLILEQKNMRINDEINQIKHDEKKVSNSINNLSTKSEILCEYVFKTRNKKTLLDKSNTLLQSQYESKLRDSELLLLELEAEIAEAEEEKLTLSKHLIETNREGMEWEKKFQNAKSIYTEIKEAKSEGGEIKNLKMTIHKLSVIYSELKKVQEKLLFNLKHCISRRESIFCVSEAKELKDAAMKRSPGSKMRINILKKMDSIRNQIKNSNNEAENTKKTIFSVIQQISKTRKKIQDANINRNSRKYEVINFEQQLESNRTNRQFKFELLIMKQRRAAMFTQILKKQKPYLKYKNEKEQMIEYTHHKGINIKLMKILEHMTKDFPSRMAVLNRLYNSLGIVQGSMHA